MTQDKLNRHVEAWLAYNRKGATVEEREPFGWITDVEYDLLYEQPEELWALILEIYRRERSIEYQPLLSAGMVESILAMYGDQFIERVEAEAKADPLFARLLGGVWKSSMSDAVWTRLQSVWDRRGWDGIPES